MQQSRPATASWTSIRYTPPASWSSLGHLTLNEVHNSWIGVSTVWQHDTWSLKMHRHSDYLKGDISCLQMLAILREQNQDAFFGLLSQHLTELLPVIYTPTVGDACKQWSTLLQRPQGLYVSIKDKVLHWFPCVGTFSLCTMLQSCSSTLPAFSPSACVINWLRTGTRTYQLVQLIGKPA